MRTSVLLSAARLTSLALASLGATALAAPAARAQLASSVGLSAVTEAASAQRPAASAWEPSPTVTATVRYDRPWLALQGDGAGSAFERAWRGTGSVYGAVSTPAVRGFRASLAASWARSPWLPDASGAPRAVTQSSARLSWRQGMGGAWLGLDHMAVFGPDSATPAPRMGVGVWRQAGGAIFTLTLGQQSAWVSAQALRNGGALEQSPQSRGDTIGKGGLANSGSDSVRNWFPPPASRDSAAPAARARWAEAEAGFAWARGRFTLEGIVGGRPDIGGIPAAAWGRVDGTMLLDPRLALVAGAGTAPRRLGLGVPARSYASFGMRIMRSPFRHRAMLPLVLPEVRPAAAAFQVRAAGDSQYVLAIRVPQARVVELSGDFTSWKPVTMHRVTEDRWEATFALVPGTYRLNIRVDGERWTAPPGTTTVADDFNGTVGVVVIR